MVPFDINVPRNDALALQFAVDLGETLFVLGANGTGKSSLIQRLYNAHRNSARRISAHRQTWFSSNAISMNARDRRQVETSMIARDANADSRYIDHHADARTNIAIYDLIDAENVRARSIASAVDADNLDFAKELAKKDAPLKVINELLRLSNLPIEISVREAEQVMASRSGSPEYSISELSDGERNALLIAATVLTAKAGQILFIDEPERHLHRSIISPLLTLLFAQRPDCAFVVSTHDVMLPLDNPSARTLLVRSCSYAGQSVTGWDADLVAADGEIDDDLKRDILGGRRKLLFVEGEEQSLDKPLYSLLFPEVSVIAKSSCRDVEHAVSGIRDAAGLHWVHAYGIVDSDSRPQAEVEKLMAKGVYAVPAHSVEALYYHPELQRRLAQRQHDLTGGDPAAALVNAREGAIAAVAKDRERMSQRVVEAALRQQLMSKLPKRSDVAAGQPINVQIDVAAAVAAELARLDGYCSAKNLAAIVNRYPIRETGARGQIAKRLGFQSYGQYEDAVRKLLMDDPDALAFIRALFGTLAADVAA